MAEVGSRAALAAAVLGFFIVTFDAVVVNVALPSIRADLGGGIAGLQWVVDGYTLMFAALLLAAGAFSDRTGARRAFTVGVVVFSAASAACGLAPGLGALIAARFVQGSAAAVMMPASMALIGQAYPDPSRRARAVAVWAMGGAIASSSALVLGGMLTTVSWRLIFLINIPVGIVAVSLVARARRSPRRDVPFDAFGFVAAVVAMGALTFGAIEAGVRGFTAPVVLASFAVAAMAFGAFVTGQRRAAHPTVPLELFARRNVTVSVAVGFAFVVGYYGLPFVMSLYLQQTRDLSAFQTGLVFLPMMLIGAVLTPVSARIVERFGARHVVATGLVLMAAGLAVLAATTSTAAPLTVAMLMLSVGLAGPLVMPPVTAVLLNSVPDALAGTASGVFNTSASTRK
jgi:MFS transporter, DHA2 family, methylenomycin A resistance protein